MPFITKLKYYILLNDKNESEYHKFINILKKEVEANSKELYKFTTMVYNLDLPTQNKIPITSMVTFINFYS